MTRHLARIDRFALGLIGLVMLAGGLLALLHGVGLFSAAGPRTALLVPAEQHYAAASLWLWPLIGLIAALVTVVALAWAVVQLRPDGVRSLALEADRSRGATRLSASAVTDALETEIESYRGVQQAHARLTHSSLYPRLVLRVTLAPDADVHPARARVENEALAHLREFLDQEELPARIRLVVITSPSRHRVGP